MLNEVMNFQDLTGTFTVLDVVVSLTLSFILSAIIGLVYKITHQGSSYTQSYVQTLVLMGMVVALIMLIVGSNIARAFSLVGALSIIRFRNAVKETRDVGYIFFAMAVGMANGTRFYLLAVIATIVISLILFLMNKLQWFRQDTASQLLFIQILPGQNFEQILAPVFIEFTSFSELISLETVRSGMLQELVYSVRIKSQAQLPELIEKITKLNGNNKVSVRTGYHSTDL
jgi:uncharacterized membrane protein YhiD involved in acid resistance